MPIYSCTTAQGTLTAAAKASLAAEITRIHAAVNHVPAVEGGRVLPEPGDEAKWQQENAA